MKSIKNLVIICDYAFIDGGATNVAIQTAIAMTNVVDNVYYFAAVGPVSKDLENSNVKVVCLNQKDINTESNRFKAAIFGIWNGRALEEFKRLINNLDREHTIVHVHSWTKALSVSVINYALKIGFPVLVTLHDYFTICPNGGLYNYKLKKSCKLKPMSWRCVLCNCDKRNYLQKLWRVIRQYSIKRYFTAIKSVHYIYISQFSAEKIFKHLQGSRYYLRNPYDLGNPKIYDASLGKDYIYMGRLSEEKGVDVFCKALSQLIEEGGIEGRAIVIGDGEYKKELEKLFTNIQFVGWKQHEELPKFMEKCRALVFPSRLYETAGLTPIEFMCHGIPCIVSNECASKEYIINGDNGLLFKNGDVDDLKNKILMLEDDSFAVRIGKNVSSIDYDIFDKRSYIKNLLDIYIDVIRNL